MSKTVTKKILPQYFDAIVQKNKRFELRKDEDDIQQGDILILKEWDENQFAGRAIRCLVSYVIRSVPEYGLAKGYCVIGFSRWTPFETDDTEEV